MGVSGQQHAQGVRFTPGRDPWCQLDRKLGGPQSWSRHKRLEEKSFASARDWTLVVWSVVRHCTAWATPSPVWMRNYIYFWVCCIFFRYFLKICDILKQYLYTKIKTVVCHHNTIANHQKDIRRYIKPNLEDKTFWLLMFLCIQPNYNIAAATQWGD
jgi:hypothetical protein